MRRILLTALIPGAALAAPLQLTYQARLVDSLGAPIQATDQDVLIELFATETSSPAAWSHTFNEDIEDGVISLVLGGSPPLDLDHFTTGEIWVRATVDSLVTPRQRLLSVPYAMVAGAVPVATTPSAPCKVGAVQWDSAASTLLVCNGTTWDALATADNSGGPVGTIVAYGGASAPEGWLVCDGSAVSRTTYSALFATLGTTYGPGDGSTTFNLPDLRGQFLRGVDDMGTAAGPAGIDNGRALGSTQDDALGAHTHDHTLNITSSGSHTHAISVGHTSNHNDFFAGSTSAYGIHPDFNGSASVYGGTLDDETHTHPNSAFAGSISASGGAETRPNNVAVTYLIRH